MTQGRPPHRTAGHRNPGADQDTDTTPCRGQAPPASAQQLRPLATVGDADADRPVDPSARFSGRRTSGPAGVAGWSVRSRGQTDGGRCQCGGCCHQRSGLGQGRPWRRIVGGRPDSDVEYRRHRDAASGSSRGPKPAAAGEPGTGRTVHQPAAPEGPADAEPHQRLFGVQVLLRAGHRAVLRVADHGRRAVRPARRGRRVEPGQRRGGADLRWLQDQDVSPDPGVRWRDHHRCGIHRAVHRHVDHRLDGLQPVCRPGRRRRGDPAANASSAAVVAGGPRRPRFGRRARQPVRSLLARPLVAEA